MAVIAAAGVAVIYIPQPVQPLVAAEFGVEGPAAAAATIAVQAGYALGVVLLVSLGDRYSARRQVTAQLVATAAALVSAGLAPTYAVHVALCLVAGAAATVGQLLVSAALRLAPPTARARTAAVLLGSFIVGLFVVRTALGALAEAIGWRAAVIALVPLSLRVSPAAAPSFPPAYRAILATIPRVAVGSPTLRLMTGVHTLCFMAFIALWSSATPYAIDELGLSIGAAALLGLAGLVGGVITIIAAPAHGRVGVPRSLTISIAAALAGVVAIAIAPASLPIAAAGLLLLSAGMSSEQVSTQAMALASVAPEQGGRANTVYMGSTFLGGAFASAVGASLAAALGYQAVAVLGALLIVSAASLALIAHRRGMLRPSSH
jgi:predicted MFS family arabinose efflux permease